MHDLRRSAAKALRAAGVPESVVMATGGWKTAAMFRRYAIVSKADQQAVVAAIEAADAARAQQTAPITARIAPQTGARPLPLGSAKVQLTTVFMRVLAWCREGESNPQGTKYRRILSSQAGSDPLWKIFYSI